MLQAMGTRSGSGVAGALNPIAPKLGPARHYTAVVRNPSNADQRSEVMAIAIPN